MITVQKVLPAVRRWGRGSRLLSSAPRKPVVNSHNEWDPLEEVIVGSVEGATIPEWHVAGKAVWPKKHWDLFKTMSGKPFPEHLLKKGLDIEIVPISSLSPHGRKAAQSELDYLAHVLEMEGVTVRRPHVRPGDFACSYKTPDFTCQSGLYAAMPRDILTVIGNEVIEAPMAWRSRFFEYRPYRELIKEYFRKGAKWTAAPKPEMSDKLYVKEEDYQEGPQNFVTTEFEPVFDAAEFVRMGRDIFAQRSQVTNNFGIEWMRRHLGDSYRIHVLDFQDKNAMHIDGTFVPLGPGKILINPKRPCITGHIHTSYSYESQQRDYCLPDMFKGWDLFIAKKPLLPESHPLFFTSPWTATCNVLLLDEERVLVEAEEEEMYQTFLSWGFKPIKIPFRNFLPFGGSFHCATCDIRRRGELQSYF